MSPMAYLTALLVVINLLVATDGVPQGQPARTIAPTLSLTVLSTMLADTQGFGEWGFAAVVEVDGRRWLFDTGARPETLMEARSTRSSSALPILSVSRAPQPSSAPWAAATRTPRAFVRD